MSFKPYRDNRPMNERPINIQIEAELFAEIKTFLTKKQQGKVMGAFRSITSKYKLWENEK